MKKKENQLWNMNRAAGLKKTQGCIESSTHFFLYKQPLFLAEAGRACKNLNFEPQLCLARA